MQAREVISAAEKREFLNFPKKLYRNDHNWICPLDSSVEDVFDPGINPRLLKASAKRWILCDDAGNTIGRIAAFIDQVRSAVCSQPTGGIGYFEVIEDRSTAFRLLDTAAGWLREEGMEAVDAPVSLGENFYDWGLLTEGFMQQGYGMNYNKRYYSDFLESYGFRNYFEQYSFHRKLREADGSIVPFPSRIKAVVEWLYKKPGYSFRHFEFKDSWKFLDDICTIYNETWMYVKSDFTPLAAGSLLEPLQKLRLFLDEDLVWFAYYNGMPVGFFILVPDFNQILRHLDGRLDFMRMLKVIYYRKTHEMKRVQALAGGVIHSHQRKGVEAGIFYKLYESFVRKPWYRELEIGWVGDYNPRMLATVEALEGEKVKTHVTYRYHFDSHAVFTRLADEKKAE